MKNTKFAFLFIFILVFFCISIIFYTFFGKDILVNKLIQNAQNSNESTAIKYYNYALKINPKNAVARNNLVEIYMENDDFSQAMTSIDQGITENPDNDDLYLYKVKIFEQNLEITQVLDTINTIESSYVKSKFSAKAQTDPSFNIKSGNYSQNVQISINCTENSNIYYKINAENYQLYDNPIFLTDGYYDISAVSIDDSGIVSREITNSYFIENLVAPVSFTTSDTISAIKSQIGNFDEISKESLENLTTIDLSSSIIFDNDIETLLNCPNLEILLLGDISNLTSFYPLTKLDNIREIQILQGCTKNLLEQLVTIPTIKILKISNSKINILPQNQTLMTDLTLSNCLIYDISNISSYKTLANLDLSQNLISDISELAFLKKLTHLNLSNNNIVDISAIINTISIKKLDLSYNNINRIQNLSNLIFLEEVNISNNQISSVQEFANLRYLTSLNCSFNNILTLESLILSKSLLEIYANDNEIKDFSYINQIENLNYINLANNS